MSETATKKLKPGGGVGLLFLLAVLPVALLVLGSLVTNSLNGRLVFGQPMSEAVQEDLVAFYRAGQMAQDGEAAAAYDKDVFRAPFNDANKGLLFLNPPHFLLFAEMLVHLSYPAAKVVLFSACILSVPLLVLMSGIGRPAGYTALMLLSPGAFYLLTYLQISSIITSLIVFALLFGERRPVLGGIALAIATIKPQYGLLVPVFLIAAGNWRLFIWASLASMLFIGASFVAYGIEAWQAFFSSVLLGAHSDHALLVHDLMATVSNSLGRSGFGAETRFVVQVLALLAGGLVVWFSVKRFERSAAVAIFLLASAVAAPSFMYYDWLHVQLAALFLAACGATLPISLQISFAAVWTAPTIATLLKALASPAFPVFDALVPLMTAISIALIWLNHSAFAIRDDAS